jgi:hypothetical protein
MLIAASRHPDVNTDLMNVLAHKPRVKARHRTLAWSSEAVPWRVPDDLSS